MKDDKELELEALKKLQDTIRDKIAEFHGGEADDHEGHGEPMMETKETIEAPKLGMLGKAEPDGDEDQDEHEPTEDDEKEDDQDEGEGNPVKDFLEGKDARDYKPKGQLAGITTVDIVKKKQRR